jgi:hypothetical protein
MKLISDSTFKAMSVAMLVFSMSGPVLAESRAGGLSYSPEHWPNRWSTAIRQKQNGKFPSRSKQRYSGEKPTRDYSDAVSEQDLFQSPSDKRYGRDEFDRFAGHAVRHRYLRDAQRLSRDAAVAYNDMANMTGQYSGYGPGPAVSPFGIGIDPVLGHPGMGIPIMPGTPLGYPIGGYPFGAYPYGGFPFGMGGWNPPFGAW